MFYSNKNFISVCLLCFILIGCTRSFEIGRQIYKIGVDPFWSLLDPAELESSLTIFTMELLEEIGKIEHKKLQMFLINRDQLFYKLKHGELQAICTNLQPQIFYKNEFIFSDIYLESGLVLVIKKNSPFQSLKEMQGKEIGIISGTKAIDILNQNYPKLIPKKYDSLIQILEDTSKGVIAGCLVNLFSLQSYAQQAFSNDLKILSVPSNQEGLRLICMKRQQTKIIKIFNTGLNKLKKNGTYVRLLKKWNLIEIQT